MHAAGSPAFQVVLYSLGPNSDQFRANKLKLSISYNNNILILHARCRHSGISGSPMQPRPLFRPFQVMGSLGLKTLLGFRLISLIYPYLMKIFV